MLQKYNEISTPLAVLTPLEVRVRTPRIVPKGILLRMHCARDPFPIPVQSYIIYGTTKYRITINFGEELNLANWRIVTKSPNLNFANIILYHIICDTQ